MLKLNFPTFNIKPIKFKRKTSTVGTKVSRKCYASVITVDGELKASVNYSKNDESIPKPYTFNNERIILPFTPKSLSLKGKEFIFANNKDEYGHYICIMREQLKSNIDPGNREKYSSLVENLLIAGYIVKLDDKLHFEYVDLIAFHYKAEAHIQDVAIDDTKDLFNK